MIEIRLVLSLPLYFYFISSLNTHPEAAPAPGASERLLLLLTTPGPLHKAPQAAAEEELAPLQRVLLVLLHRQRLAAAELAGHGPAVVVAVGVLKVTTCAEQRPVQLQHGTARPAAHQDSHMEDRTRLAPAKQHRILCC